MKLVLSNQNKCFLIVSLLMLFNLPHSNACDDGYATITSIQDLGGGVTRYFFEYCPEFLGLEGAPDEFDLEFFPAAVNIVAFTPPTVSTSDGDIYTGSFSSNILSWATGALFPVHNTDILCFSGSVDVTGTVSSIIAHEHIGRADSDCNEEIYNSTPPSSDLGCADGNFYDAGGVSGDYPSNANPNTTSNWLICADNPNDSLVLTFDLIDVEIGFDYLTIYDGIDNTAPLIQDFIDDFDQGTSYSSSNVYGCLYVEFISDGTVVYSGWDATITCIPELIGCLASPTLSWD